MNRKMYDYLLDEVKRVQYEVRKLIGVERYAQKVVRPYLHQSLLEHLAALQITAKELRHLVDPGKEMDMQKVLNMLWIHDHGEIVTGDRIDTRKTEDDSLEEDVVVQRVLNKIPQSSSDNAEDLLKEFKERKTKESRYAYAIDKLESHIWWCSLEGVRANRVLNLRKNINGERGDPLTLNDLQYKRHRKELEDFGFTNLIYFLDVIHDERTRFGLRDPISKTEIEEADRCGPIEH